jgi:hypothetical protein
MPNLHSTFHVRFANGQGNTFCSSLREARRYVEVRAEYDPPPPGVFPGEIWEGVVDLEKPVAERQGNWHFVERHPPAG